MGMMDSMNSFVDTMIAEKNQFETMQNELSGREQEVSRVLDQFGKKETDVIQNLKARIAKSGDESMQAIFNQTSQSLSDSIQESNDKLMQAVNGMKFIEDFERHFTVSVFGKVKAGKSYIGNFIMGQPLRKAGIASSYDQLEDLSVHVYDRGKMYEQEKLSTLDEEKECNGEEFYVNKSEATSTIQWVDIGGMCWFDTPGIGSVTQENEDLAKDYVKNSDLVIFACNSDAAGTRQEFDEIRQLHAMEKPILLLLTQSDTYDYDVDEDGNEINILIPKSDRDRADQEQYMLDTLREQGMEDVLKYADILTVSALLATEALKSGNEQMFEQSNMGLLLEKLTDITKNEAAQIKKNTPRGRMNEMLDNLIRNLNEVSSQITKVCQGIEQSRKELMDRKGWMVEQIRAAVNVKAIEIVAKAKAEVEKNASVISGEQISEEVSRAVSAVVQKVCTDEAVLSTEQIPDLHIQLTGIGDMKMKQDRIAYKCKEVERVTRPPEGIIEHIGDLFGKTYYTSKSRTVTRYSTFDIGVNDNEIARNIVLQLESVFSSSVDAYVDNLTRGYYEPVEILEKETTAEIARTVQKLAEMRM